MAQEHSVFSNIQDNRTSSLAEQVADQINQVIIDQNINAGEKLPNEFELAARLNVGRGTIREGSSCWWHATVWRSAGARALCGGKAGSDRGPAGLCLCKG